MTLHARFPLRMEPGFLIIGAQRCGTSSFYYHLTRHPAIAPARVKEVHFFDLNFHQGRYWYRNHFPSLLYRAYVRLRYGYKLLTGEASPYYLFHPLAADRIAKHLPKAKLIVLLRNPVDRAYSQYWKQVRAGWEKLPFEAAIEQEPVRLRGECEKIIHSGTYHSIVHQKFSYLNRGIYADQLQRFYDHFPKDQILLLSSESYYAEPIASLQQAFAFLQLPPWTPSTAEALAKPDYPDMKASLRAQLSAYFQPHNERLYACTGRRFGWPDG